MEDCHWPTSYTRALAMGYQHNYTFSDSVRGQIDYLTKKEIINGTPMVRFLWIGKDGEIIGKGENMIGENKDIS